jgi:hypothetical protein
MVSSEIEERSVVKSDKQRLNLVLQASSISSCVILNLRLKKISNNGGGVMHSKLANLTLLKKPYYYRFSNGCINYGEKPYISKWFMDSTLFGISDLYRDPIMQFNYSLANKVTIRTAKFGLNLLIVGNLMGISFESNINYNQIHRKLKKVFRSKYLYFYLLLNLLKLSPEKKIALNLYLKLQSLIFKLTFITNKIIKFFLPD